METEKACCISLPSHAQCRLALQLNEIRTLQTFKNELTGDGVVLHSEQDDERELDRSHHASPSAPRPPRKVGGVCNAVDCMTKEVSTTR